MSHRPLFLGGRPRPFAPGAVDGPYRPSRRNRVASIGLAVFLGVAFAAALITWWSTDL